MKKKKADIRPQILCVQEHHTSHMKCMKPMSTNLCIPARLILPDYAHAIFTACSLEQKVVSTS